MGGLDGRDDALGAGQIFKGVHSFIVGDGDIFRAADVMEPCVLRADAGIVQTGGNGVHRGDLAVFILAEIGLHAVENAQSARVDGGGGLKGVYAAACRFTADEPDALVLNEVVETADGVGAAAHAGDDGIRQTAFLFQHLLLDLLGDDPMTEPRQ